MRADLGSAVPSSHISKVKVFTEELQEKSCLTNFRQQKGKREGKRHTGVLVAPKAMCINMSRSWY